MNILHLKYVVCIAENGSLNKAAEEMHVAQPNLSRVVREMEACACDGIEECRMALLKKSKNALDANFIEGMACVNGCIGGAGNLTHGEKNKAAVDSYGREALEKTILDAIAPLR